MSGNGGRGEEKEIVNDDSTGCCVSREEELGWPLKMGRSRGLLEDSSRQASTNFASLDREGGGYSLEGWVHDVEELKDMSSGF
jgi:hypothetical protein